jgi:phenylpropionate dioxygenase-like ring-hydroxylating dioxygenase large terminal subunit
MAAVEQQKTPVTRRTPWPAYAAARLGLPNYWYPVLHSRDVGRKPRVVQLMGEPVMFVRDGGRLWALYDECPHRGVPLSEGRREFPGTWTCRYHGWTFDVGTGELRAALSDGPRSAICGKVHVRTYPVEEHGGLVWIYLGRGVPPPAAVDIPPDILAPDAVVCMKLSTRAGNWRLAAENGWDSAHALYLHRDAYFTAFTRKPIWREGRQFPPDEDGWLTRVSDTLYFEDDFPGLGRWPRRRFWETCNRPVKVGIRLPCLLRVSYAEYTHYEWYVPVDERQHHYVQMVVKRARGLDAGLFRARYWLYLRWLFHGHFNSQDARMVELMREPEEYPERLFRPDVSITAWRKLFDRARGEEQPRENGRGAGRRGEDRSSSV